MTIGQAKDCFMQYDGHGFHMCREEPDKYSEFKALNIPRETQERWRQELLDEYIEKMRTPHKDIWCTHSRFLAVLIETKTLQAKNCRRLSLHLAYSAYFPFLNWFLEMPI